MTISGSFEEITQALRETFTRAAAEAGMHDVSDEKFLVVVGDTGMKLSASPTEGNGILEIQYHLGMMGKYPRRGIRSLDECFGCDVKILYGVPGSRFSIQRRYPCQGEKGLVSIEEIKDFFSIMARAYLGITSLDDAKNMEDKRLAEKLGARVMSEYVRHHLSQASEAIDVMGQFFNYDRVRRLQVEKASGEAGAIEMGLKNVEGFLGKIPSAMGFEDYETSACILRGFASLSDSHSDYGGSQVPFFEFCGEKIKARQDICEIESEIREESEAVTGKFWKSLPDVLPRELAERVIGTSVVPGFTGIIPGFDRNKFLRYKDGNLYVQKPLTLAMYLAFGLYLAEQGGKK